MNMDNITLKDVIKKAELDFILGIKRIPFNAIVINLGIDEESLKDVDKKKIDMLLQGFLFNIQYNIHSSKITTEKGISIYHFKQILTTLN